MATKKAEAAPSPVSIPAIEIHQLTIWLVGDEPLICHRWSEKAKKEMRDKQMKKAKQAKEAKDPKRDFIESLYRLPNGRFGFPTVAFKAAAVGASRFVDGVRMTETRGAFHVVGAYAEIYGTEPVMREDMVRVGMGTADLRYRGQFTRWAVRLDVKVNTRAMSPEQVVNMFNTGGFGVGVGEWRPEKGSGNSYGTFHVATSEEIAAYEKMVLEVPKDWPLMDESEAT